MELKKVFVTENQRKVIEDKYLKDSPSIEAWLDLVAHNIALAELLHSPEIKEKDIFKDVNYKIEEFNTLPGQKAKVALLHKNFQHYNEWDANFKVFIKNLYIIAETEKGKSIVEPIREKFYDMLSNFEFLPNSPTLMNAGRRLQQLSACYVLDVGDSIEEIFESVKNAAMIHKCLTKDTLVLSNPGLKQIHELKLGERIMTEDGYARISEVHFTGTKPVFKVLTNYGYEITGSKDHLLRIIDKNGDYIWKSIGELKAGDWIAIQKSDRKKGYDKLPEFRYEQKEYNKTSFKAIIHNLPNKLNTDLSYLFGAFLGDGSYNISDNGRIRFTIGKESKELVGKISSIFKNIFQIVPKVREEKNKNTYELSVQSVQIVEWMKFLGIEKPSARKIKIPTIIFGANEKNIAAFLRGLFDTDGAINQRGYITLTTSSEELANQLQIIMLLLGIPAIKRRLEKVDAYQICVTTRDGFINFKNKIGFFILKKAKRLESIDENKIFSRKEYIPNTQHILNRNVHGRLREKFNDIINNRRNRQLNKKQALEILNEYNIPELKNILKRNQFYVRVKEIKDLGMQETFDITVPGKHHYIANGFISHNSGGGTGFSFSRLRPANDEVKSTHGIASGPLSFMQIFDKQTDVVRQGGTRRGANMGILRYDHPDIMGFINMKKTPGVMENFNVSVAITKEFMNKVKKNEDYDLINPRTKEAVGKLNAREVWNEMIKGAWETGDPGFIVIDRINETNSNPTPHIGEIESTNPCVTGDTLISTEYGLMRMKELVEEYSNGGIKIATDNRVPIEIMNIDGTIMLMEQKQDGISFNLVSKAFYSGVKDVYRLVTSSGYELEATEDHKIFTLEGKKKLKELKPNENKVLIQCKEGKFNEYYELPFEVKNKFVGKNGRNYRLNLPSVWSKELGQILGLLIGDGWVRKGDKDCRVGFTFSKNDKEILDYIKSIINNFYGNEINEVKRENNIYHLSYHSKYFMEFFKKIGVKAVKANEKVVPESIFTAPKEAVIGFLQGLFTADGTISYRRKHSSYIRLTSKSIKLLKGVQILLLNLGIKSNIYDRSRPFRDKCFRYVNRYGKIKNYKSDGILYELEITRDSLKFIEKIGFIKDKNKEKIKDLYKKDYYKTNYFDTVKEIINVGKKEVYDLTEPITHSFICNSIVVSNCGEQPLLPYEPCNLGSINLSKFVKEDGLDMDYERLKQNVFDCVHFLDNVIDVNNYPIPQIEYIAKTNRRIGLGVMGLAETLVMLGIPYNDENAFKKAEEIMKFINDNALLASEELAKVRGVFPNWKNSIFDKNGQYFRIQEAYPRNSARTTIAPTGTIGITAGLQGAGIEPFFAVAYVRYNAAGIDALKKGQKPLDKDTFYEINPLFKKIAEKNNYFDFEEKELWKKIEDNHKSILGIKEIPQDIQKLFLTSHDLSPLDHVNMQCAFQKYTDNAVSKTVNLRNEATIKDVEEVYTKAYELGAKGVTIYRDGSKQFQILNLSDKKEKKGNEMADYYEIQTGQGPLHVHINYDKDGPTKVFANLSPIGTEISGLTTALGIILSKYLENGGDPVRLIKHLNSIKGDKPLGFGPQRVDSIPHGISKVLRQHLIKTGRLKHLDGQTVLGEQTTLNSQPLTNLAINNSLYCPKCFSTNVMMVSGCSEPTCIDCGYSECG